ncbi:hypothetical protein MTBBW1_2090001 [Desulfamplus magnetovallimortis]|uniref:Uncharacterized protein n=1 Tax=Desulfamplus magnetovallimortis TaxID=1246637 RepID=A0A1W1HC16_9BACT|nr:hypothetical protein MTBBW1_2090001 [Desulfamplus magnetovallimortis]
MADDSHNRKDESRFKNRLLPRLSYKSTWRITAKIEGMKVVFKTGCYGDFHITYMADYRHNRRDESRFKNSHLLRLSYKNVHANSHHNPMIFTLC